MKLRVRGRFGAAALVAAVLAAGCGSDSQPAAEAVPRLTKPQLVNRLGDICQEHTDHQVGAIERFDKAHGLPYGSKHEKATAAQLERELVQVLLPIVRDNIHDLEELRPSRSQEADFEAFLRALEHGIAYSERDPSWVLDGEPEPFVSARKLSWKLGTALCGQA